MDELINQISDKFKNYLFIISNDTNIKKDNVIESKNLIKIEECDINENAYITTFCDIIFGRCSGTHTFSYIKENIITENIQYNISNTNLIEYDFGIKKFINKSKKFIKIDNKNINEIIKKLELIINEI